MTDCDIVLSTAIVNALSLFKSITGNTPVTIISFKERGIIKALIIKQNTLQPVTQSVQHKLVQREKRKVMCRKRFQKISIEFHNSFTVRYQLL